MASISGVNTNSILIVEILSKKGADVRGMLLCRYRSPKKIFSYTDINGSIAEAAAVITINIVRALNISVIIYTMFAHS